MEKLNILGTGCAMVTKCYNTCFTLCRDDEHLLVDTGGGNTILVNLEKLDINIEKIHNVFISHSHNDHILGIVWIVRAAATSMLKGKYEGNLNIYCHKSIIDIIKTICYPVLQKKFTNFFDDRIIFIPIEDNFTINIMGYDITFFDIRSKKDLQFGFTTILKNRKKFTFLGDEPYRDSMEVYAKGTDYLLHESYCLYADRERFKPYEKSHATVKDACENAENLSTKNVILYHTEDKNISSRKELYTSEGRQYFHGNLMVPDDLEVIEL